MRARNVARNREAQTHAARLKIAAFVEPMKRPERFLAPRFRNARPVIIDENVHRMFVALHRHRDALAVLQRIVHEIGDATPKRIALDGEHEMFGRRHHDAPFAAPRARRSLRSLAHKPAEIGAHRFLTAFATRELQIFVEHFLHLENIGAQRRGIGAFRHHRKLQLDARERRFEIVTHARKHIGALLHKAFYSFSHRKKRARGAPHFARAIRFEIGHGAALAETFRRNREPLYRPHLIAQEDDRDAHKHDGRTHHPQYEYVRTRNRHTLTRHDDAQYAAIHLDADMKRVTPP